MAYEVQKPISTLLASQGVKALGQTLKLTNEQIAKANASALQLRANPSLYKCDSFSLIKYCYEIAINNFTRTDCAYPVPYGNKVQCQISFRGFKEMALRSGNYKDINAVKVYDCDKITRDRETGMLSVNFETDYSKCENAKLVGYFAYAKDTNGDICNSVYWSVDKCVAHGKKYSKAYNSIWGDTMCFDKMALKTVIKQLCNELNFINGDMERLKKQDQIVYGRENERDEYLDNPNTKQTNVSNVIESIEEDDIPVVETPKVEVVETKKVETPKPVETKKVEQPKVEVVEFKKAEQPKKVFNDVGVGVNDKQ